MLLTLFVIVSICFPQLPARFFMVSWLHWGAGVLPISYRSQVICTVPMLLQRVVKLPVWFSDARGGPFTVFTVAFRCGEVFSYLFLLMFARWNPCCFGFSGGFLYAGCPDGCYSDLDHDQGEAGPKGPVKVVLFDMAFSTSQAPRLWCSIWHLEKCMMPAVGFEPPEFWRMGWGRVRSDGLNCPTTEKLEAPQAYTFFWGLNSAPSQQRNLQLFHLLDHEGQRSDWTDRVVSAADWGRNALWESPAAAHERSGSAWRPVSHFFAFFLYLRAQHVGMCLSTFQDMQEATGSNYLELLRNQAYLPDRWNHD